MIISAKKTNRNITIEDLIFLHLLNNYHDQEKYIVSELLTEKGMQNELNCSLCYISRVLKKIEKEGYVYRRLMRIEKKKRKYHAFFLTDEGLKLAKRIKEKNSINMKRKSVLN